MASALGPSSAAASVRDGRRRDGRVRRPTGAAGLRGGRPPRRALRRAVAAVAGRAGARRRAARRRGGAASPATSGRGFAAARRADGPRRSAGRSSGSLAGAAAVGRSPGVAVAHPPSAVTSVPRRRTRRAQGTAAGCCGRRGFLRDRRGADREYPPAGDARRWSRCAVERSAIVRRGPALVAAIGSSSRSLPRRAACGGPTAPTATPAATTTGPGPTPAPTPPAPAHGDADADARADPDADADPDTRSRPRRSSPAPLTGRLVTPDARGPPPDRGHDRRPLGRRGRSRGFTRGVGRLAGARPRAASRATWLIFQPRAPDVRRARSAARASTTSWAAEWKAVYVHVGGSPAGAWRSCARRATASSSTTPTSSAGAARYLWRIDDRFAPHNVYTDGKTLRRLGEAGRRQGRRPTSPPGSSRPTRRSSSGRPAARSASPTRTTTITYRYDRAINTWRRSVDGQGPEATRRRRAGRRAEERRGHGRSLRRCSATRPEGPPRGRRRRHGHGPGSPRTARRSTGRGARSPSTAPTRFFDAAGKPVTLTVGQTFVQVMPRARRSRSRTAQARSSTPAKARPSRGRPLARSRGRSAGRRRHRRPAAPPPRRPPACRAATSAQVRRSRARPGRRRRWRSCGGRGRRPRSRAAPGARRSGSRGSTRRPAGPTSSGSAPTALATTGVPAARASSDRQPGRVGHDRRDRRARARDEPGRRCSAGSAGRVGEQLADAGARRRRARPPRGRPGVASTSRIRGGHGTVSRARGGRPAAARRARASRSVARSWRAS